MAGTTLYCLSKAVGLAIGRAFADNYPIAVITHLYHNIGLPATPVTGAEGVRAPNPDTHATVPNAVPWLLGVSQEGLPALAVSYADAGRAIDAALAAPLRAFPSRSAAGGRFEVFFISAPLPHGRFSTEKAAAVLGWRARDRLESYFRRPASML